VFRISRRYYNATIPLVKVGSKDLSIVKRIREARLRRRQRALEKKQQEMVVKDQSIPNETKTASGEVISDSSGYYWDTTGPFVPFPVVSWIRSALFSTFASTTSTPLPVESSVSSIAQPVEHEKEKSVQEEKALAPVQHEETVDERHAYLHHANKAFETTTSS
jgi:hypothetical protein